MFPQVPIDESSQDNKEELNTKQFLNDDSRKMLVHQFHFGLWGKGGERDPPSYPAF